MGKLYVVGTPIGNLSDISQRALDTLKEVDIILCEDTRHSLKLLNHYDIKNKLISYHKFNEKEKTPYLISQIKDEDKNIALITDAGMPCVSDPGYVIVEDARKNNIEVVGVGGISALTTAISISGIDSTRFGFYGFFPRETKEKNKLLKEIKESDINTLIFYESPKRIINTLEFLKESNLVEKICICSDLTKLHEKAYYGTIDKVLNELKENENHELGEYTFVILKEEKQDVVFDLSIEAMLVDIIIKENVSLKEAIDILNKKEDSLSKKDIYNASLNIKSKITKF